MIGIGIHELQLLPFSRHKKCRDIVGWQLLDMNAAEKRQLSVPFQRQAAAIPRSDIASGSKAFVHSENCF
jgi:hypothetical protein